MSGVPRYPARSRALPRRGDDTVASVVRPWAEIRVGAILVLEGNNCGRVSERISWARGGLDGSMRSDASQGRHDKEIATGR